MDVTLLLPRSPSQRPPQYTRQNELQLGNELTSEDLEQLANSGFNKLVKKIIAGPNTNRDLVKKAHQLWPNAHLYHHHGDEDWRSWEETVAQPTPQEQTKRAAPRPVINSDDKAKASTIAHEIFLRHVWGSEQNRRDIERFELQAESLLDAAPNLDQWIRAAKRDGDLAFRLARELNEKLSALGDTPDFQNWFEDTCKNITNKKVVRSLQIELKKSKSHAENQRAKQKHNRRYRITTPGIIPTESGHPNALTNLVPADKWTVLVDETGKHFDHQVDSLSGSDVAVGKVIAIAIPEKVKLKPLSDRFHAKDESNEVIEKVLHDLTSQSVGIFGFSSKDPASGRFSWLQQIDQLVRWVLRLLPIDGGTATKIEFLIEQRDYKVSVDWQIRTETILAELNQLDPDRYSKLQLHIRFIPKSGSSLNGYVDTVANCWGSPQAEKRKLLRHFSLLDHCLLQAKDERVYERLLLSLESGQPIRPADWYLLLQEAGDGIGNNYGLLSGSMEKLGEKVRENASLWRSYLLEVQRQLRNKTYSLVGLVNTLSWLGRYQPVDSEMPLMLQLRFLAAQLAANNHRGLCDPELVVKAVSLANRLVEEDAPQACEVVLRAVVAATNNFDFSSLDEFIDQWLKLPVATVGLLNHAKLLSTQGQLLAFKGQTDKAIQRFDEAIAQFDRLTDDDQKEREIAQTRTYKLFAYITNEQVNFDIFRKELLEHLTHQLNCPVDRIPNRIASSDSGSRFAQHIYLRALVTFPEEMKAERTRYLALNENWNESEEHPWPLIIAYRAWLLAEDGNTNLAKELLQRAIDLCDETPDSIVQWIGCVLHATGSHLGVVIPSSNQIDEKVRILRVTLPSAPHDSLSELLERKLSKADLFKVLNRCLPFNFH